jgi:tripartite-type tricarboxylate transporter receptor subunit TctC
MINFMTKIFRRFLIFFFLSFLSVLNGQTIEPIQGGAPIKLIVPFTPGTGIDTIARAVGPKLSDLLGQPVVIDNRPGASGNIGTEAVVRAKADGTTLLVTVNTIVMNRTLYPKASFDPLNDLSPITLAAHGDLLLVVPESSPFKTASEFIAAAKANPGKLSYASPGVGTPHHLAMEMLKNQTKTFILHVPYRGTAPAVTDLLGSQVDAMFLPIHVGMSYIKSNKLRALGIGAKSRNPNAPTIPTFSELKIGEVDAQMWFGFMAPKGVPNEVINKLGTAIRIALSDQDVRKTFLAQGLDPTTSSPQVFADVMKKDAIMWAKTINEQGIKAD